MGGPISFMSRNPVRAGMVDSALVYRHAEYLALGQDEAVRLTAYRGLFATGDEPEFLAAIRDATNGGFALVGNALKSSLPIKSAPSVPAQVEIWGS
jgi:hypothetical protein